MTSENDFVRFTLPRYLLDSWGVIATGGACLAGVALMLSVLNVGTHAVALVASFVALCFCIMLGIDFARRAHFYRSVSDFLQCLENVRQFTSFVDEPDFLEGRLAFRSMERLTQLANAASASEHEQEQAHREYIELWIHEIKTPIAAAKLMLSSMHGEQALKLKRELERIEAQVEQALYSARATSLANDYTIRDTNLASIVRAACKKNARYLIEHEVSIDVNIADDLHVLTDEQWCRFVLGQVIGNAAKYGASNISFTAHEEDASTPHGRTVLEVRDNGCGIPASDVPRVFDRGFTGQVGRAHGSATGMGLYLVARMCERMGVGVGLASEQGTGTRVMLSFPHDRSRLA